MKKFIVMLLNTVFLSTSVIFAQKKSIDSLDTSELISKHLSRVTIGEKSYFLGRKSGDIYEIKDNKYLRLDKTPDHRMTMGAYLYTYNDTIFKYGGYGFWSQRNFIYYFDFYSHEWQLYPLSDSNEYIPEGSFNGCYNINNSKIIFWGGKKVNSNNRVKKVNDLDVILFDHNRHLFKDLGELNINVNGLELIARTNKTMLFNKDNLLYEINPFENTVTLYNKNSIAYNISNDTSGNYIQDNDYYINVFENDTSESKLSKFTREDLFGSKITTNRLYKPLRKLTFSYWYLLFLPGILCFILIFKRYIKSHRIILIEGKISIDSSSYDLNSNEYLVLKEIITNNHINNYDVLSVVENSKLTETQNIRSKENLIEKLNLILKVLFKLKEDPIFKSSDKDDKRIKVYHVTEEFKTISKLIIIK